MAIRIKLKTLSISLCAALAGSMILSSVVAAAQTESVSQQNEVKVIINGELQNFSQPAVKVNGRILVPLRSIFEKFGATVEWTQSSQVARATKGDSEVLVQIGNKTAYVNYKEVQLDVPAQTINGSTMVPLRFVSEAFGAKVEWDNDTNTVTITMEGLEKPSQNPSGSDTKIQDEKLQYAEDYWGYNTKIKVRYGKHAYGVKNQAEYDEAMKIVDEALKGLDSIKVGGEMFHDYYMRYLDGDRATNHDENSEAYWKLSMVGDDLKDIVESGVDKNTVIEMVKIRDLAIEFLKKAKSVSGDGSPRSIYDALVRLDDDCDSTAQTLSAFFDSKGYNTAVVASPGHADVLVEVNGSWFKVFGSTFEKTKLDPYNMHFGYKKGLSVYLQSTPTY